MNAIYNDPRRWAYLAYKAHPTWSITRLVDTALTLFYEYRHWQIKCIRFLRAEDKYAGMFPCSPCLETATVDTGTGELTRVYFDCYNCQSNLSTRVAVWFVDRFLPLHPEWSEPDADQLRAELTRLRTPQMQLFAAAP